MIGRTNKIFEALKTLKKLGNKYYQFIPDMEDYKNKCQNLEPEGFHLLFETGPEKHSEEHQIDQNEVEQMEESDKEEEEYVLKDESGNFITISQVAFQMTFLSWM